jgi:hypothetical protein
MPQAARKMGYFSYGDYCQWPEGERWELIDGEAFAMAPAPTRLHQEFVVALAVQVDRVLTIYRLGEDGAFGKPDIRTLEEPTPVGVIADLTIHWPPGNPISGGMCQ